MAEGFTHIYLKGADTEVKDALLDSLQGFGLGEIEIQPVDDEDLVALSFEHAGTYDEKKLGALLKKLVAEKPGLFVRARHYDDYATEIYWLDDAGKLKRYQHEVDSESGNIVKAYRHWHAGLGALWDGHFDNGEIQRIADRFGAYDENGKAIKGEIESLAEIVSGRENFFHRDIRAPYASHKFDQHIAVLQSYAAMMAARSEFVPEDRLIRFSRSFLVKDAFGSDVIGFVWSWQHQGRRICLVISWHGELAVKAKIVVDHEGLTTDELIYLSVFDEFLQAEAVGDRQWVYRGIEQLVWPPSLEYVWDDQERDREKYHAEGLVLQFMHVALVRGGDGNYRVEFEGYELCEIDNADFGSELEAALAGDDGASRIRANIQLQFTAPTVAGRVLGIELFAGDGRKCTYRRFDPPDGSWPVPEPS